MEFRNLRLRLLAFTYDDWLLLCFVLGVFAGTGAALAFGDSVVQGGVLGAAGAVAAAGSANFSKEYGMDVLLGVWKQRAMEAGAGWLAGLTVCSQMLFGFLTFYGGMSLAVVMSVLTMRKGILGIIGFLCTVLPHGIIYILVWYVLSRWAGPGPKKLHILPGILLLLIAGAGVLLEVYVSPVLCGLL